MVNDPFRKWDRVYTICALLVDLGQMPLEYSLIKVCEKKFCTVT